MNKLTNKTLTTINFYLSVPGYTVVMWLNWGLTSSYSVSFRVPFYPCLLGHAPNIPFSLCVCVCAYVCGGVHVCVGTRASGSQRSTWDNFLDCSPPHSFRQALSLNLHLTDAASSTSLETVLSIPPKSWGDKATPGLYMGAGERRQILVFV